MATLESYLKSLPQFLGIKQQRFQILRTNGELDEEFKTENGQTKKYVNSNAAYALCFDYDSLKRNLDLNLETYRMTEAELNNEVEEEPIATEPPAPSAPSAPVQDTLFSEREDKEDMPF